MMRYREKFCFLTALLLGCTAIAAPLPISKVESVPDDPGSVQFDNKIIRMKARSVKQSGTFYTKCYVRLSRPVDLRGKGLMFSAKTNDPAAVQVFAVRAFNRDNSKPSRSYVLWETGTFPATFKPYYLWDDGGSLPVNQEYITDAAPDKIDRLEIVIGSRTPDRDIEVEFRDLAVADKKTLQQEWQKSTGDKIRFAVHYAANTKLNPNWPKKPQYATAPAAVKHPVGLGRWFNAERIRANAKHYPWANGILTQWKKRSDYWLSLDDEAIKKKFPIEDSFFKCLCPKCKLESEFAWKDLEPDGESIRCTRCKTLFPNPDYPENSTYTITRPDGSTKTVKYYHGPDQISVSGENWGPRYHLTGVINYRKSVDVGTLQNVAFLYALEKRPELAAKVRDVLLRYADVYAYSDVKFRTTMYSTPEGSYMAGKKCAWKFHDSSMIPALLTAYTLTVPSGCYSAADRLKIENQIFREYLWMVMAYPPTGDYCSNAAPAHMYAAAYCGVVLGDHAAIDWALKGKDGLISFVKQFYYRNGSWHESTASYAGMANAPLENILLTLQGYSDLPSYRGRDRYDKLDLFKEAPELIGVLQSMAPGNLPTNRLPAVNDSAEATRPSLFSSAILAALRPSPENQAILEYFASANTVTWYNPLLLCILAPVNAEKVPMPATLQNGTVVPGFNWAILRRPATADKAATLISFPVQTSHSHHTMLNLIMCEDGREIVNDLGYLSCWHETYKWIGSPAAHNLVVVNDQGQSPFRRGEMEFFQSRGNDVQAMRVAAKHPYTTDLDRYARTVVDLPLPNGRRYTVDYFDVRGGTNHTWIFHATGTLHTDAPWQPATLPKIPGTEFMTDPKTMSAPAGNPVFNWQSDNGITRVTALPDKPSTYFTGIGPGQRDQGKAYEKIDLHVLMERNAGINSAFIHLIEHEAAASDFAITGATRTALPDGHKITVTLTGGKNDEVEFRNDGRIIVRRYNGKTLLQTWQTGAQLSGKVEKVDAVRGKIYTDGKLRAIPPRVSFAGCALQIRRTADGTYLLASAAVENGKLVFTLAPGENCRIKPGDEWIAQPILNAK